ncbi:MAG: sigma-70 family RNA polymerase sigma factor [Sphingobacteriales bacterium]|nr:MAG: sigma-70 family RNA polymerase sigma factor [Sphingobacteriales bacterium]
MPEYAEQDIIKGCRKQDRACQEYLYKKYYSLFLKICARYAKDMEDAEQLMNDGFLRIFTKIDSYENTGSFEGWMKRILVNTCLDYLRSSYLKTSMMMNFNINMVAEQAVSTRNEAITKMEFRELLNHIQTLPTITKTVFNLFVFDGYTHAEIAKMLAISEGTSYWHVHQARKLLQKKINSVDVNHKDYASKRV